MWHIYTMEYYSAIKGDKIGSFGEIWMNLESVTQSEVNQNRKNKHHIRYWTKLIVYMNLFAKKK